MTNRSPFSPALSAFRVWQAIEPGAVVEAIPIDEAFQAFETALTTGNKTGNDILRVQAIALNAISCRLFELAADARGDYPKFVGLMDLGLRAQDQCRQSIDSTRCLNGSNDNG